jgi:long-chain acyl-CoA synthetase
MFANQLYKTVWKTAQKSGIEKKLKLGLKLSRFLKKIGIDARRKIFKQVLEGFGGNLKYMIVGAAALNGEVAQGLYDMGIQVSQGYGITECAPLISVVPFTVKNFASCGKPMPGLEVMIDKENENDLSGEIVVKGGNVMLGYYNNEEQTKQVLTEDGWFRTGDYGYMDKHGYLYITGRKKNIIISSDGKNIFPEEIEEYLDNLDLVSEVVVVGRESDKTHDIEIVALVYPDEEECKKAGLETKEAIHDELAKEIVEINKQLATYKHINRVELRDEPFEKTTTRKIKRNLVK